jgi:hypothetical protein
MGLGLFVLIMIVCGGAAGALVTIFGPRHPVVVVEVDRDGYMIENGVRYGDGD